MRSEFPRPELFERLVQEGTDRAMESFDFFTAELVRRVEIACNDTQNFGLLVHCQNKLGEIAFIGDGAPNSPSGLLN